MNTLDIKPVAHLITGGTAFEVRIGGRMVAMIYPTVQGMLMLASHVTHAEVIGGPAGVDEWKWEFE